MRKLRVRIVGGSLAGLFAALLLQKEGHDIRIYERSRNGLAGRGAGLVSQRDLLHLLRLIGCEHVAYEGVVAHERIYLDRDGSIAHKMQTPQAQISWDVLFETLAQRILPAHYRLGHEVTAIRDHGDQAEILFQNGEREMADLVIGADGLGSIVRTALNPDHHKNVYSGYVAWRGLLPEKDLPREAALLLDRLAFFIQPGIHILGYLIPGAKGERAIGKRRYNWVWYRPVPLAKLEETFTDTEGRARAFSLPRGHLADRRLHLLREDATRLLPPQFALAVGAEPTPSIQGIFDYEAQRMVTQSIALIGDAAFVARPHTAMGVSKAAGDVMALASFLGQETDLSVALRLYEADRSAVGHNTVAYGQQLASSAI